MNSLAPPTRGTARCGWCSDPHPRTPPIITTITIVIISSTMKERGTERPQRCPRYTLFGLLALMLLVGGGLAIMYLGRQRLQRFIGQAWRNWEELKELPGLTRPPQTEAEWIAFLSGAVEYLRQHGSCDSRRAEVQKFMMMAARKTLLVFRQRMLCEKYGLKYSFFGPSAWHDTPEMSEAESYSEGEEEEEEEMMGDWELGHMEI